MAKGTVKWFNPKKGFGFVVNEEGLDVFVHYKNIQVEGFRNLKTGQVVEYTELNSKRGLFGENIQVSCPAKTEPNQPPTAPAEDSESPD
jgi:CspA family cold shock protein